MSDNSKREIGISYSLFATGDGEVFSGGGGMPRDEFVDQLTEDFARCVKDLTDENPNRTIIFSLETEATGESRVGWMFYTEKHPWFAPAFNFVGRLLNRASHWLWGKAGPGKWVKKTLPGAPWAEWDEDAEVRSLTSKVK